jgi:hypothetical protein
MRTWTIEEGAWKTWGLVMNTECNLEVVDLIENDREVGREMAGLAATDEFLVEVDQK